MSLKAILKQLGTLIKGQGKGAKGAKGGEGKGGKGGQVKQCYCCGAYNHLQKDCTKLHEKCHGCGEEGHLLHMCPHKEKGKGKGKGQGKENQIEEGKGKGKGKKGELKDEAAAKILPRPLCPNRACTFVNQHGAVKCAACKTVLKKMPTYLEAAAKAAEDTKVGAP